MIWYKKLCCILSPKIVIWSLHALSVVLHIHVVAVTVQSKVVWLELLLILIFRTTGAILTENFEQRIFKKSKRAHMYSIFKEYMIQPFLVSDTRIAAKKLPSFCSWDRYTTDTCRVPVGCKFRIDIIGDWYLIFWRQIIENVVLGPVTRPHEGFVIEILTKNRILPITFSLF